jgi:microcystin-dependent protein
MADPYLGEIKMFGFNFAPLGWAFCNGGTLPISSNSALFALLGTTFGGNGTTTFGLPDLRGRFPMHFGNGPGLSGRVMGEVGGSESTTLVATNLPPHTHSISATGAMPCSNGPGNADDPTTKIPAGSATDENYTVPGSATGTMAPLTVTGTSGSTGAGAAFTNMPPFLAVNFCIALQGIFPSRA